MCVRGREGYIERDRERVRERVREPEGKKTINSEPQPLKLERERPLLSPTRPIK